mmetsp:Transcript_9541/g.35365  ORF Transcript_9541/g.35365 Transcript_9541/m.35365 type:complete len:150 (-) Transcript_9541:306-755(-)
MDSCDLDSEAQHKSRSHGGIYFGEDRMQQLDDGFSSFTHCSPQLFVMDKGILQDPEDVELQRRLAEQYGSTVQRTCMSRSEAPEASGGADESSEGLSEANWQDDPHARRFFRFSWEATPPFHFCDLDDLAWQPQRYYSEGRPFTEWSRQ